MEEILVPVHRFIFAIPHSLQIKVCLCESPTWMQGAPYKWVNYCGKCEKPMRYLLEKCRECDVIYIRDFMHDGRCIRPKHQKCWNCFQKTGKVCDCPPHRGYEEPIIIEPAGLNPKRYSSEELENVFDF